MGRESGNISRGHPLKLIISQDPCLPAVEVSLYTSIFAFKRTTSSYVFGR